MEIVYDALKVRMNQGKQFVPDVRAANPKGFRGLPVISNSACQSGCNACADACPTTAIQLQPMTLDLGRCVFCDECAKICPEGKVQFSAGYRMASTTREGLIVREGKILDAVEASTAIQNIFGRSLKLRSVSAGGCNGCELEINAMSNVNFDMGRYGIDVVASPRHADGLILSGPISANMAEALELCYEGMPDPKFVIAAGTCAISGGVFDGSAALDRSFLGRFAPALYVAGCPPHPLSIVNGILDIMGHADGKW
jgi:Ni,Fe-hydrogenase III small subunit/Pyruvate/2-oxoacid:ferredoxin oxidoreductase delta subunit